MTLAVEKLTPNLGAEIRGVDLRVPLDDATFGEIWQAFNEHGILLIRDQELDDDLQVAFSQRFGPLEVTFSANPAGGSHFARQSNLDIDSGQVIPPEDRRIRYQLGNQMWHSDSSFRAVPSLCSLLSARLVPQEGGETEFASTRAAYASLSEAMKRRLDGLIVEHSVVYSRGLTGPDILTPEQKAEMPASQHVLVRQKPDQRSEVSADRRARLAHRRLADRGRPCAFGGAAADCDRAPVLLPARMACA